MPTTRAERAGPLRAVLPVPEPNLTPDVLVARATALMPLLRAQQDENDARGAYSDELHQEFLKAGLYRTVQPRMFGGYEFDIPTFYKAMMEISRGHPAVGWCLTLCASHAFLIGSHWSEEAQREFFGSDGYFSAPHRPMPMGTCTPAPGGYRVSGQWNYCSGISFATHFVGGAFLKDGQEPPKIVQVVVPRARLTILDDWGDDATMGMRASGSNSVKVSDVFVPAHHVVTLENLGAKPDDMSDGTPGTRLHGNPMYLGRLMGPYHASLVSPIVGAARAALDEYEDIIRMQKTLLDPTILRADNADFQRFFGEAFALTDAAEAIVLKGCERYMDYCRRWAEDGTPITVEENLRLWTMIQQGGRLACEAVEVLFHTAGSAATRKGSRIQRYFNDVAMYRSHVSSQFSVFAGIVARAHLGKPTGWRNL
jgi:3-hydroxy-9,10-secoandrosta-1,3,5(10)-triene-9,17-dione monooxygenase